MLSKSVAVYKLFDLRSFISDHILTKVGDFGNCHHVFIVIIHEYSPISSPNRSWKNLLIYSCLISSLTYFAFSIKYMRYRSPSRRSRSRANVRSLPRFIIMKFSVVNWCDTEDVGPLLESCPKLFLILLHLTSYHWIIAFTAWLKQIGNIKKTWIVLIVLNWNVQTWFDHTFISTFYIATKILKKHYQN